MSSECERGDGILFSIVGGGQIVKSMKRKVTLSREGSTHSPLAFPVATHSSLTLSLAQGAVCTLHRRSILYRVMYCNGLTATFITLQDFMVPLSDGKLDFFLSFFFFNPVILNGFVICFRALN